jgi:hypothetical protein
MRVLECNIEDSSTIEHIRVDVKPGKNLSSLSVRFISGAEYYYPSVSNMLVVSVIWAESIGGAFNKLISQDKSLAYSRLDK